jgi:hypothetical protein
MADEKAIKEVESKLKRLQSQLDAITSKSLDRVIKSLNSGKAGIEEWNKQLDIFQNEADNVSNSLSYIAQSFKDSVNELSNQNKYLTSSRSIINSISKTAQETLAVRKGETSIDEKSIKLAKEKINTQRRQLQQAIKKGDLSTKENEEIEASISSLSQYEDGLEGVLSTYKDINKQLGFSPQLAAGLDKALGSIGIPNLGIADALDETQKLGQEAAISGENFSAASAFTKQMGGNIGGAISKANVLQAVVVGLVEAVLAVDQGAGDMAKNLNLSYTQALDLQQELAGIANYSNDNAINTKRLGEALSSVNAELGTSGKLTEEELKTMVKLKEQSGLAYDTQVGLFKYAKATGQEYADSVSSFQAAAKAASYQKGIAVNTKQLMVDMNNVSNRTKLSIQGGAAGLATAAVSAKLMGGNLSQVADIADQLLNFESSIENELSAELLTGKDLNLERARGLALNNDMAGVAEEITKQAGSAAEFGKMNRIQQEAIAKAVGMSADQLADTLVEQEALKSINKELDEDEKKAFETAKEKYGIEEASKMLKDGQLDQMVEQQSTQEKFNDSVEKLKEIFVTMAPALLTIGELLTNVLSIVGYILTPIQAIFDVFQFLGSYVNKFTTGLTKMFPVLKPLVSLFKGLASIAVVLSAYLAYSALAPTPFVGPVLGAIAAAAVLAAGLGAISAIKANDMVAPAPGGGYGKRTLMGPEGAIQLNDKDTVIAGTNLFGNDVKSEPGKATQMGNKGEIKVKTEGSDMSAVIAAINNLASRPINVSIDGKKVIEATTGAQPNTQGEENRKNSYKMS